MTVLAIVNNIFFVISLLFFCQERSFAAEKPIPDRIQVFSGLTELGPGIGIRSKVGRRSYVDYSVNYLPLQYSFNLDQAAVTSFARLSLKSFGIDIRHYLRKDNVNYGFYASAGLRFNFLGLSSRLPLSDGFYDVGGIKLTCSKCPDAIVSIKNKFRLVPGFSFGYSSDLSERLSLDLSAGVQYFQAPEVGWEAVKGEFEIPYFVSDVLNDSVREVNDKVSLFFPWIPVLRVSMSYRF